MQYRVYDRQTLKYRNGGFVVSYDIDDDYIVNNNSTISVVKNDNIDEEYSLSRVVVGDIIVLIQDSGAFHKGVITAVDDTALSISYKSDKELFNDNMLNPMRKQFVDDTSVTVAGKFGVEIVIAVFQALFVDTSDPYKKLPITFLSVGDVLDDEGNPKMLWTWDEDEINLVDWLTELFENYNFVMSFTIDFNTAEETLANRQATYVVTFSAITNSGGIIKDNVDMQTITYTSQEIPDATVCYVIDSTTKEIVEISSGTNLLNPASVTENTTITISGKNILQSTSTNTNVSAYISISTDTDYTYSQASGDTNKRYVIFYDKDKNVVSYITYRSTTTNAASFTLNTNMEDMVLISEDKSVDDIKYVRINYCNTATQVQFEKGSSKTTYDPYDQSAIFYLYEKDGEYSISTEIDATDKNRILPVKTVIATYSESTESTNTTTPQEAAEDKLIPSQFNQAIEIRINADSKMFDFANARFGDLYKIINEYGTIDSVYTGKKFNNSEKWVTLYFGLGRQRYTDLIQIRLRKNKYTEIYNQG